jgi:hypothetical protein
MNEWTFAIEHWHKQVQELNRALEEERRRADSLGSEVRKWRMSFEGQKVYSTGLERCLTETTQQRDAALDCLVTLASNTLGVVGCHLNGDVASWDEVVPDDVADLMQKHTERT